MEKEIDSYYRELADGIARQLADGIVETFRDYLTQVEPILSTLSPSVVQVVRDHQRDFLQGMANKLDSANRETAQRLKEQIVELTAKLKEEQNG